MCLLQDLTGMFAILPKNQPSGGRSENRSGFTLKIRIEQYYCHVCTTKTRKLIFSPSFDLISYQRSKIIHVNRLSSHLHMLIFLSYPGHMPTHQPAQSRSPISHQLLGRIRAYSAVAKTILLAVCTFPLAQ